MVSVFMRKHLSPGCGGQKYYDHLLKKFSLCPTETYYIGSFPKELVDVNTAWIVFRQQFIDDVFNKDCSQKWTAVPYLNPMDSPCATGSVILLGQRTLKDALTFRKKPAFFAGTVSDYCPSDQAEQIQPISPTVTSLCSRLYKRGYQARYSEKAVIFTLNVQEITSIEHSLCAESIFLDLSNFEDTGFSHRFCFIVTKVITAERLTIEVTEDGDIFYERTYESSTPICFQTSKVLLNGQSKGFLISIEPVKDILLHEYRRRRYWQGLFNSFMPNQARLGNSAGDAPAFLSWCDPITKASFRPRNLPRLDRKKNNCAWYFEDNDELLKLRYLFSANRSLKKCIRKQFAGIIDEEHLHNIASEEVEYCKYPTPPLLWETEIEDLM